MNTYPCGDRNCGPGTTAVHPDYAAAQIAEAEQDNPFRCVEGLLTAIVLFNNGGERPTVNGTCCPRCHQGGTPGYEEPCVTPNGRPRANYHAARIDRCNKRWRDRCDDVRPYVDHILDWHPEHVAWHLSAWNQKDSYLFTMDAPAAFEAYDIPRKAAR